MDESRALFKIDRLSRLPLYDQIQRNIRQLILDGHLREGQIMPSEWELAELYDVSRLTVRKALDELVHQRWLRKRQGVGTFVTRPKIASIAPDKLSFTQQMLAIGRTPSSRLLSCKRVPATAHIASLLGLEAKAPLVEIVRIRLADGQPILLECSSLPYHRFPDLLDCPLLESGSLYAFLAERYGVEITRMEQRLKPVLLTAEQARLLDAPEGSPSIRSDILAYSHRDEAVEYSWSVANGEHSEFYFSFLRASRAE